MRWLILLKFLKIRAGYRESTFSCLRKYIIIRVYGYVYVPKKLEEKTIKERLNDMEERNYLKRSQMRFFQNR